MSVMNPSNEPMIIEVEARTAACVVEGCTGVVVRHSLGGGQSIDRCTRCFRRYELRAGASPPAKSRLRRMLDEFASWQDR